MYRCKVSVVDKPNANGVTHTRNVMEDAIKVALDKPNGLFVTLENVKSPTIALDKLCGRIETLEIEGDEVIATFVVLTGTPGGDMFQIFLDDMPETIGLNMNSTTTLDENKVVNDDFKIIKFTVAYLQEEDIISSIEIMEEECL
jgi:hypothetical protein